MNSILYGIYICVCVCVYGSGEHPQSDIHDIKVGLIGRRIVGGSGAIYRNIRTTMRCYVCVAFFSSNNSFNKYFYIDCGLEHTMYGLVVYINVCSPAADRGWGGRAIKV